MITGREVSEYINTIISSAVPSRSQGSQMITNDDTILLGDLPVNRYLPDQIERNSISSSIQRRKKIVTQIHFLGKWLMELVDFDDLIGTLREKRELAQTLNQRRMKKSLPLWKKRQSTGLKFQFG